MSTKPIHGMSILCMLNLDRFARKWQSERASEWMCVRSCIFDFRFCRLNWPFLNRSYFMVVSNFFSFSFSFPFGFKFDQGLFMAILLVKIARSSFLISCDLSRLMWITVFLVVWAIFKSAICVWDPDPQCANVVCACARVCLTESTAQVYPFKCGHSE